MSRGGLCLLAAAVVVVGCGVGPARGDADADVDADTDGGADADGDADDADRGGDEDAEAGPDGGPDADVEADPEWAPCPLYVDQPTGVQAECATVEVPLRWTEPEGPTIGIFVQRLRGTAEETRGQLWLLEGGPGGSGADFDEFMEELRELDPTLDLYAVDHRGVGRSARLGCPVAESAESDWGHSVSPHETPACLAAVLADWGGDLDEMTTTAAARDLGRLIEVAAEPGRSVFVYGVSYGTYWALRYLQLFPDQATAVVLDSIAPPGESFLEYDADLNEVARDFMDLCAADAVCASKLGEDPWAAVEDLLAAVARGHCAELGTPWGLDATTLKTVLAYLLMSPVSRTYLPALVYRYARCEPGDVDAIDHLLTVLFASKGPDYRDELSSDALFYNVALSELWPNPDAHPTTVEVAAVEDGLAVTTGLTPRVAAVQDIWPAYPDDEHVGGWPVTDTPLLMMNGDLDPLTPIWSAAQAGEHLAGPGQWFYTIPRAAHCAVRQTPVAEPGDRPCGLRIMLDFLDDPTREPDSSCIADVPPEDFAGDPAVTAYLLGTPDLWENTTHAPAPLRAAPPPRLARALTAIARARRGAPLAADRPGPGRRR